jgi:hypothetical protein
LKGLSDRSKKTEANDYNHSKNDLVIVMKMRKLTRQGKKQQKKLQRKTVQKRLKQRQLVENHHDQLHQKTLLVQVAPKKRQQRQRITKPQLEEQLQQDKQQLLVLPRKRQSLEQLLLVQLHHRQNVKLQQKPTQQHQVPESKHKQHLIN